MNRVLNFEFKQLPIVSVYGEDKPNTRGFVFELKPKFSNKFVLVYIPFGEYIGKYVDKIGLDIVDIRGVIRNKEIHDILPNPAMTINDFINIKNDIIACGKSITSKTYIVYAVDLEREFLSYDLFDADNIKIARHIAKFILEKELNTTIKIKNLMLNPAKNSSITYVNDLNNSYIGKCAFNTNNKYFTKSKYLVGVIKANTNFNKCDLLRSWHEDI